MKRTSTLEVELRAVCIAINKQEKASVKTWFPGSPQTFETFLRYSAKVNRLFGRTFPSIWEAKKPLAVETNSGLMTIERAKTGEGNVYVAILGKRIVGHLHFSPSEHAGSTNYFYSASILGKKFKMEQYGQSQPFNTWRAALERKVNSL